MGTTAMAEENSEHASTLNRPHTGMSAAGLRARTALAEAAWSPIVDVIWGILGLWT